MVLVLVVFSVLSGCAAGLTYSGLTVFIDVSTHIVFDNSVALTLFCIVKVLIPPWVILCFQ
jgi:hypothetical protein